jgi:zinc protease
LKQAIGQRDALKYESNAQKSSFLANIIRFDIPADYTDTQKAITENMQAEDILALAKTHLPLEKMIILVVGDKNTFSDELMALDLPITELDAEGKQVP